MTRRAQPRQPATSTAPSTPAAANPLLVSTLDSLRDQTALISAAAWGRAPTWEHEAAEHRAILQAAESGAADEAAGLLRDHMRSFVERARNSA
ncbi:FCD domain-containing protein [Nonomuraea sp. H19]|uniref:FCD domain-containing protein n=1 Tax=Nonomuraea sp. H19 TaxID=3452206 RepID=UPI003F8A28BB